jgi:hypothetical protein
MRHQATRIRSAFIFDSSHHLNYHSNFIPKIALLGHDSKQQGHGVPTDRFGRNVGHKGGAKMTSMEMASGGAEPASAEDCFGLGMVFSAGAGVPVDLVQAHKWFNIAAMRGHKDAAQLRREIAEQMSDSEIGCAQRAARDWLKAHPETSAPVAAVRVAA